jgi:cytochrome P460
MKRVALISALIGALLAFVAVVLAPAQKAANNNTPQYTPDGKLMRPDYREWVFLSSGLGMTYANPKGGDMFSNIYVNPEAYHSFQQTGTWPDKTMLIMEMYGSATQGSINKGGHFQSGFGGIEAHVKDTSRPGHAWKFYGFGERSNSAPQEDESMGCTTCHSRDGAVEDTFVQFYPTLLPIARAKRTVKPGTDAGIK